MKKRKKKSWIKRATATGMAVCMTLTSSTPLLADGVTADTEIQEITDEEFASGDSASDSTETSNQTENIESGEPGDQNASADFTDTEIQPEDTDPAETGSQLNGTESEEGEDQPDTIGSEDKADSAAEDSQEIHLSLELIAEDVGADAQEAKLTLAAADKLSTNLNVKNNTVEVTGGEGLILLSNVKPEDYKGSTIKLITTSGWDLTSPVTPKGTSYSFQGLGSETCPYAGTLELDASTAAKQYSITTTKPLFQALSTKATLSGTIPFSISETAPSTKKPLLADVLIAADGGKTILKANIVLRDLNSDKINDAAIGGLIGTMKAGTSADITFENQFTKDLKVSGESHTGLFCSTMEQNTSLTAEFSNTSAGKINVEAGAADAGGFVGHIETDASLTAAGNSVTQVSSVSGNAGGLAGSATDGSISIKEGDTLTFADTLTLKSASDKAAGGLIGEYTVTKGNEIGYNLSGYKFNNIAVSGGGDAGGLFGVIRNTSTAGTTVSVSGTTAAPVKTAVTGAVTNLGGLIGSYQSDSMDNTLSIKGDSNSSIQTVTTGGINVNASYGGVVGIISGSSYVEIENVSASTADMKKDSKASFGGLVGKIEDGLLNVGSVTLATADSNDLAADADGVDGRGGLVGHLVRGVMRLHGTTDLRGQKITTAYNHTGQIVGNNENGLVYALGNGNTSSDSQTGWKLTRYSGTDRSGSDIGNWGSVVRLGEKLTEGANGVFLFDETAHTVKVNNGTGTDIGNENAFAAYALAFDLLKAYTGTGSAALSFNSTVDPEAKQTVTLSVDIDLTGTGILGIGKDSVEKNASAQKFQGTLNGNNHTITLDIGTAYGAGISDSANAAGQLYARRKKSNDAHYSLALIPFSSDATIQNVTIEGKINCKVPKTVDQETKEESPAFVSAVVGLASGTTSFNNVTVNAAASVSEEPEGAKKLQVWQGGFLGQCEGSELNFEGCTWENEASLTDERGTDHQRIGGLAADVLGGCTVSVKNCTLSGRAASNAGANARVGGLIAVSRGENKNGTAQLSTINISDLMVNGERINVAAANKTSGGLLGYQWKNTNVVFAEGTNSNGVNISGSTLNADSQFGGLVYQATGYWKATAANSIVFANSTVNTFTGKSSQNSPSGLLVGTGLVTKEYTENNETKTGVESALYLEVGTWGNATGDAYKIGSGAVTLAINNSDYFDELVGITKYNDAGNNNAVVSLAVRDGNGAVRIDQNNNRTTYTGQIDQKNYKNSKTRYYYNLDSYRKNNLFLNLDSVNTPENLVLWSAAQYAAPNIRGCFRIGERTDVTISGEINLTGYSYYPVTPLGAVNLGGSTDTHVTFDYDGMNTTEESNKKLSDSEHQHYLMQHGLFYNVSRNIKVNNTTFAGTVGKEKAGTANTYNSGALIYGSVTGDPVNYIVDISLNNVTLAGIRVTGVQKGTDTYAPLLINKLDQAVRLTVNDLSTGTGYTSGNETTYAATSLVGEVGSETATKLTLFFSNIALDGRLNVDMAKSTSVFNNGNTEVKYHTTHTIFTKATLLDSFMYSSEGSGTYNFNTTDNKVTYGVELTNSGTTGRNPDKQYQYYDADTYISDETGQAADEAYVKNRYAGTNFIRYVYTRQNTTASQYELDINQKTTGLLKGCGTYGDPYIIEDAHQLSSLAAYIQKPDSVSKFQAVFNQEVLKNKSQTADGYHTQNLNAEGDNATEGDILCTWENKTWTNTTQEGIDQETATQYLLNAYYKISKDLTISAGSFSGLGTLQQPFSGVIVGANKNIKVSVTGTNENKDSFGGLIAYSRGSVVKDLTVDYSQATIAMQANDSLPGTTRNPFFGGVVGYCMGGDTIIDKVSVNYADSSISFDGKYSKLIAAGGYVGLVGGAARVTEESDYEKTGGGVVFRNMDGTTNSFTAACADAGTVNKTVNADGKTATTGGNYFYRNPYIGRVLDGYACAEECTVNNTDKNYTIPTLQAGTNDLKVTEENGSLNVTVTSAQGLWLLSAIVNSGAGAMDADGNYTDVDGKVVDAYQYGKPRTGTYDGIGTDITDAASVLSDEAYWGGTASTAGTAKNRVSYLVKKYTTGTAAARLAGKSSAETNIPVNVTFDTDSIDMSSYGNGFRGIGSSYGENKLVKTENCSIPKVYRRNLLVNSINANRTTDATITLNINQNDYKTEYEDGSWRNQGAGLFVDFHFTEGCKVNHLGISGNVKVGLFDTDGNLTYVTKRTTGELIGVGGFAARTANSKGTVSFENFKLKDIQVYGGVMTGGAIGYIDGYNNSNEKRNVTFTNWTIDNEKVSTYVYMNGSTGGLVGWNNSYGQLTITGSAESSDKVNVNNLTVSTTAEIFVLDKDTSGSGAAGGLVGLCEYGSAKIENVNVMNVAVSGKNAREIGGLLGSGRQRNSNNDKLEIINCTLNSIKITLDMDYYSKIPNSYTGGVIGYHEKNLKIFNVTVKGNSVLNGQQFSGGFVGYSANMITIDNCSEENTNIRSDKNWIGGFIGYVSSSMTAKFNNCQEEKVNILGRYAGGLVGTVDGDITASNMELVNVMAVTNRKDTKYTGLITGATDIGRKSNSIKCYNILADSCKTGYNSTAGVGNLSSATIQEISTSGFWIGQSGENTTINLTAVAATGDVFPQKDIGTQKGSATIIYADASVDQTYKPEGTTDKPSSSAAPWLDVNPKSDVPFADGTVMTGNGAGTGTASQILGDLNTENPSSAYYWNLKDNKTELAKFLDSTNDAYVTTYRSEESKTTTVGENVDFPVLVVNNTADVDAMLWNYIAAMTNVKDGTQARTQSEGIKATTYKWNQNNFVAQDNASLSVDSSGKKISLVPNAYDNQNSQFTLLDVTYANPTNDKAEPFHLYIPVLVKKVLYISFKARFLAGTDYCAEDYPMKDSRTDHYATAGFDEPLTAYIEYNYEKETDWQSMLDNGENLLWYYDKILDLAAGSTAEQGNTLLPEGTRLTLLDRQKKQYYIYTTTGKEDLHGFDLSQMKTPDGKAFTPVSICDLLELTAKSVTEVTEGKTYYVEETDYANATVRIGTKYYRRASEEELKSVKITKYSIVVSEESKTEARTESYYLTIQIPTTAGYSVINNRLNYGTLSRKEGTLPAVITSENSKSGSAYVVYNGVEQTFKISSSREHNGSVMGDTTMENGDSIIIKLESKLKLTEAGKDKFDKLGPAEFYHEFDVSMKKYLQKEAAKYDVIGTEMVDYTYTLSGNGLNQVQKGSIQDAAGLETLTLKYGGKELKMALEQAKDDDTAVTVTAEIRLTYAGADHFPVRDTSGSEDDSGISPEGVSRIANAEVQLPITENKKTTEDNNRYYITNPSRATLTYYTVDGAGVGDTTQQLGINPSDETNPSDIIYTRADYNYSNVDENVLKKASQIRYKLELFQKNANGIYDETAPLAIGDYLQNLTKDSKEQLNSKSSGQAYQWEETFEADDTRSQTVGFHFTPLTGEAFENAGYTYANYRVRLTAVLLNESGAELEGTKATDYIIYTNARICQEILERY